VVSVKPTGRTGNLALAHHDKVLAVRRHQLGVAAVFGRRILFQFLVLVFLFHNHLFGYVDRSGDKLNF
jgi:hypothetical protein